MKSVIAHPHPFRLFSLRCLGAKNFAAESSRSEKLHSRMSSFENGESTHNDKVDQLCSISKLVERKVPVCLLDVLISWYSSMQRNATRFR